MKKILFLSLAFGAAALCSCGTYTYRESTSRFVEPSRAGFITPVVADMDVREEKISNEVEITVTLKAREINAIMAADMRGVESPLVLGWKKYALAQTLKKYNADDIVSPNYEIAPSATQRGVLIVTVTGHPAVYKNYRKATKEDIELIKPFVERNDVILLNGTPTRIIK